MKKDFKTLIVFLLSIVLCLSIAMTAACNDGDTSSSSSSSAKEEETYPTDYQTLTNGDFEFSTFKKEDKDFPVSSSISWSIARDSISNSAASSSYTSGIINTEKAAFDAIASTANMPKVSSEDGAEYFNPGTHYDGESNDEAYIPDDENTNEETKLPTKGTKVLMLHNEVKTKPGEGTAQKATSSATLKLDKGQFALLTVWVNTHGVDGAALKSTMSGNDYGAYIAVQNTVSSSCNPLVIKNIQTNGAWVKYSIYLEASDFSTSSFKLVLGLGFGSSKIKAEYVEGFAFFDDAQFQIIDKADYDAAPADAAKLNLYEANGETYTQVSADKLVVNAAEANTPVNFVLSHARPEGEQVDFAGTFNKNEVSATDDLPNATNVLVDSFAKVKEESGLDLTAPLAGHDDARTVLINLADASSYSFETSELTVKANSYVKVAFWAKAQLDDTTRTGLSITLKDLGCASDPKDSTTAIASNVNTNKYENANYNDWREYVIYLSNTSEDDRTYSLTFDFGPTTKGLTENWNLAKGYVVLTNFNTYRLTEDDYSIADTSSYSYAKKVSLYSEDDDEESDSYTFNHSVTDNEAIKNGVATNVKNYTGVNGGNYVFLGGTEDTVYAQGENVSAGLINTEYYAGDHADDIKELGKLSENEYLQPLYIKTENASYGYVGSSATLSANTTTLISVKVKVYDGAVANVYLVNADALEGFNVLTLAPHAYTESNGSYTLNDAAAWSHDLSATVTADTKVQSIDDGWVIVSFCVTTGNDAVKYRVELWNGSRDGQTASTGIVLFDEYKTSSTSAEAYKLELHQKYDDVVASSNAHTQFPTKVDYTDDDGKDAVKYETFEEKVIYEQYENTNAVIASFETVSVPESEIYRDDREETSDDTTTSSSSEETSETETSFSWALQITSIIIAAVLIALLIAILVRMLIEKFGKKKSSENYYNRDTREQAHNAIEAKKAKAASEEVKPYDYDNPENNA